MKDSKTGEKLLDFDAREVNTQNFDAGFAGGGIASGGQSYVIATNKDLSEYKKKAYSMQAIVDGTEYKVLSVQSNVVTRGGGVFKPKREYVLFLG